jgi:hypothetical protein
VASGRIVVGPRCVVPLLEVCLFFALACSCAAAFDSDRTIAQFAQTAWGAKDGAPSVVRALPQSADGYLWLGSSDGLYRFDGVVFERYQPQSGSLLSRCTQIADLRVLPHFRCKGQAACGTSQGSTRALSSSNPARPYIWRLMAFSRLICPSMGPLLHGVVIESSTAFKSRRSVLAN